MAMETFPKAIMYASDDLQKDEDVINTFLSSCYENGILFDGSVDDTLKKEYERLINDEKLIIERKNKIKFLLMQFNCNLDFDTLENSKSKVLKY